jgi:bifunctional non-homologous end joining protein LigD
VLGNTIAPFAVRARPGLGVAAPILWEELNDIDGAAQWNIATLPQRLEKQKRDPWADYLRTRQSLTVAMRKKLGLKK